MRCAAGSWHAEAGGAIFLAAVPDFYMCFQELFALTNSLDPNAARFETHLRDEQVGRATALSKICD